MTYKWLTVGELVDSNRLAKTPYNINFKKDRERTVVCNKTVTSDELQKLR